MEAINLPERLAMLNTMHVITYAKQKSGGVGGKSHFLSAVAMH